MSNETSLHAKITYVNISVISNVYSNNFTCVYENDVKKVNL